MRYLSSTSFHISALPIGLKLVLTMYLIANLFGLVVSSAKYGQRMDLTPASVETYYQGEGGGEPRDPLELLPGEGEGKTSRYLTDVTHPHLFTVPLVLLVVAHLAHLTRVKQGLLAGLDAGAFLGFFLMFGTPWVLSFAPTTMALLLISGAVMLTSCMAALCVIPLIGMWRPRPVRAAAPPD